MRNIFNMENTFISIDKALEFVGDNSRYQKKVIYIFSLQWALFSFLIMGMPFLFENPQFICKDSAGQTYQCTEQEACRQGTPEIDPSDSRRTLTRDFELYCANKPLIGLAGSVFFLGSTVAGMLISKLSDTYGRKYALIVATSIGGVSIIISGLSTNIYMFIAFLGLSGIGLNGFETLSLVYVSEISADRFRNYSSVTLTAVWGFAQVLYSPLNYYVSNWRFICILVIGLPFLISVYLTHKHIHETPRFLISKLRFQDAKKILNQIAIYNRKPQFNYKLEGEEEGEDEFNNTTTFAASGLLNITGKTHVNADKQDYNNIQEVSENYGYVDLLRYPSLRFTTICMIFLWIFKYFTYYGLAFSLPSLGEELHENFLLTAVAEIVACLISAPIKLKLARKKSLFGFSLLSTAGCLLMIFFAIPDECFDQTVTCYQKSSVVTLAMVVRFAITIYGSILLTYTSEVYPTVVRSLGYGLCMSLGKIGNVFMPIIVAYVMKSGKNPMFFFGLVGVLGTLWVLKLPETAGREMCDHIEETKPAERALLTLSPQIINKRITTDDDY